MDVRVGRHSFSVVDDEFAPFWARVNAADWEPRSFSVIDHFLTPTTTFVDVGAWIGPLTLYAAHRAAACHAVEPDALARACLEANVGANPGLAERIVVCASAVAESSDPRRLGSVTSEVGGDSMSSLLYGDATTSWPVDCVTLEELVHRFPDERVGLVKMDIEGSEVEALSGSREFLAQERPPILLSVHARFWPDPRPRMERLLDVLSPYALLMTTDLVRLDPEDLLDHEHLGGLFELVAA